MTRNLIYRTLITLAGMLMFVTACGKSDSEDNPEPPTPPVSIVPKGKVLCMGQGIADVVVSDGTYFTQTDSKGAYELPLNSKAKHIFISTPAGYTVRVDQSVPMFWAVLADAKDRGSIDFELTATGDDTKHRFVAVGDPQIRNNDREKGLLSKKCDELAADIKALHETLPVHVMVAGDVAFNNMEIHPASRTCFSKLGQPVYYAIGNHDHKPTGKTDSSYEYDKTADADFIRNYGPTCYSFNRGKVHYIVFDNIYFKGGSDGAKYDIFITTDQLAWIGKDLSYVSKDHAVVLMAHSPTQTRRSPDPSKYGNSDKVHALVRGYAAVQFITGHTHYNTVVDANNTIEHVVGALCGGFWESSVCLDGSVLGYKLFEVDGTTFKWHYTPAEAQYKEKLFTWFTKATLARPLSDVSLQVNVWDYDIRWKAEYSDDDGATWKNMTQSAYSSSESYDPTAYRDFGVGTDNVPTGRGWITAGTTDHLFSCTVGPEIRTVKVRVTTRFGEVYSEDINL